MLFDSPARAWARIRILCVFAAVLLGLWLCLQLLVFRSGLYADWVNPDSNAGAMMRSLAVLDAHCSRERPNVLMFGDSRIGEGLSAKRMNETQPRYNFINLGLPGSSPRTQAYLLREVDRRGCPYVAVLVGLVYADFPESNFRADWPLDRRHLQPLLGLSDLSTYPASYHSEAPAQEARRAILLPLLAQREDVLDFLRHPLQRLRSVKREQRHYVGSAYAYGGRDAALPALTFTQGEWPQDTSAVPAEYLGELRTRLANDRLTAPPDYQRANRAYLKRWLGDMAERAQARGARIASFALPRGPYHAAADVALQPSPVLAEIAAKHSLEVFDPAPALALERPDAFFDALHLNARGRVELSDRLLASSLRWLDGEDAP